MANTIVCLIIHIDSSTKFTPDREFKLGGQGVLANSLAGSPCGSGKDRATTKELHGL